MQVKVSVLGHFGEGANLLNGQTIKTKIITEELQNQLGQDQVLKIDTCGGWKTLLKAPFQVFRALKNSTNVLIFPAHNGLRVYAPLLTFIRPFFKNRKMHYVVIGGWLPDFLTRRKYLSRTLKKFDGIYVETSTMKCALEDQGFSNVHVMPNCKKLDILKEDERIITCAEPYRLCTFSRVMREKGIEDAVNAVKAVNEQLGRTAYTLDIYGQIDSEQTEWFNQLKENLPDYISYGGLVPFDKSVAVLKDYFALLFPTYYEGEGFAGTVIDAYAAGVPVIASDWKYNAEIVIHGESGLVYSLKEKDGLKSALKYALQNTEEINAMGKACIEKAADYSPSKVVADFIPHLV